MGKSGTREQKRVSAYGAGRVAIFSKVVSEGLPGKVISQQRPEGSERVRHSGTRALWTQETECSSSEAAAWLEDSQGTQETSIPGTE